MSTEVLVDTVSTTTDSCQMVATETTLQVTAVAKSDNQTTINEAYLHVVLSMNRSRLYFQS